MYHIYLHVFEIVLERWVLQIMVYQLVSSVLISSSCQGWRLLLKCILVSHRLLSIFDCSKYIFTALASLVMRVRLEISTRYSRLCIVQVNRQNWAHRGTRTSCKESFPGYRKNVLDNTCKFTEPTLHKRLSWESHKSFALAFVCHWKLETGGLFSTRRGSRTKEERESGTKPRPLRGWS